MLVSINGVLVDSGDLIHPLHRAVFISLFTWRRAGATDETDDPFGWWGDSFPNISGDRIGSKLYLLRREKNLPEVRERARQYALDALSWLKDDGLVLGMSASCQRASNERADLIISLTLKSGIEQFSVPDLLEQLHV